MSTPHRPADRSVTRRRSSPPASPRRRWRAALVVAVSVLAGAAAVAAAGPARPAVAADPAWAQVDAGFEHTCAVTDTGAAYCWGDGSYGQLGIGVPVPAGVPSPTPVETPPGVTWASISAGLTHTCAVTTAGAAYCWGSDAYGQLGNGWDLTGNRVAPFPVDTPAGVTWASISTAITHTCATTTAGQAYCWGEDHPGKLGNGAATTDNQHSPSPVDTPPGVTWASISAVGAFTSCGTTTTGGAYCWGGDATGRLGNGPDVTGDQPSPSPVVTPTGVTWASISAASFMSCATTTAGAAYCWGNDFNGKLGNGPALVAEQHSPSPVDTPAGVTWAGISAHDAHACAVTEAGAASCWGSDFRGRLGNGPTATDDQHSPSPVDTPTGVTWAGISAGLNHSCAVTVGGDAYCWGDDALGQLGNGPEVTEEQPSPSRVLPPTGSEPPGSGDEGFLRRTYRAVLDREADPGGLAHWAGRLEAGAGRPAVADAVARSPEGRVRLATLAYFDIFDRFPDEAGIAHWVERLAGGMPAEDLTAHFVASPEAHQRAGATPEGLARLLYRVHLDRAPDDAGLAHWTDRLRAADTPAGRGAASRAMGRTGEATAVAVGRASSPHCLTTTPADQLSTRYATVGRHPLRLTAHICAHP